jgi:hypothetical protein
VNRRTLLAIIGGIALGGFSLTTGKGDTNTGHLPGTNPWETRPVLVPPPPGVPQIVCGCGDPGTSRLEGGKMPMNASTYEMEAIVPDIVTRFNDMRDKRFPLRLESSFESSNTHLRLTRISQGHTNAMADTLDERGAIIVAPNLPGMTAPVTQALTQGFAEPLMSVIVPGSVGSALDRDGNPDAKEIPDELMDYLSDPKCEALLQCLIDTRYIWIGIGVALDDSHDPTRKGRWLCTMLLSRYHPDWRAASLASTTNGDEATGF